MARSKGRPMRVGIRQKIVLVLVGVLIFSTTLNALVASFVTDRQNEDAAYADLKYDLLAWEADWQAMIRHLRSAAIVTVSDVAIIDQLGELMRLDFNATSPARIGERVETVATLGYRKTIAVNRLQLALRTGGFSSIDLYMRGALSHSISTSSAGMSIRRPDGRLAWIVATTDARGDFSLRSWPAWPEAPMPVNARQPPALKSPTTVSIVLTPAGQAVIEISVPIQGVSEDMMTDAIRDPITRFYSELTPVDENGQPATGPVAHPGAQRQVLVEAVFRKTIDRSMIESIAGKTGRFPALFSPTGGNPPMLDVQFPSLTDRQVKTCSAAEWGQCVAWVGDKSFYVAFKPWQFDGRTWLMLGIAVPRDGTVANIRQAVGAILLLASLTMLLSAALGLWWVKRFTEPIVNLTSAVKRIAAQDSEGSGANPPVLERLGPVDVGAPGEVGSLAQAFNDMIDQLQRSFETLEHRVQARTAELRQQARYLRTLIDMLPMRAWLKDTQGRFLAVNQAEADLHGADPREMVGKSVHDIWPPEMATLHQAIDQEVMQSRRSRMVEEAQAAADGVIWLEKFKAPVLDEDGSLLGTVGVARDITERKATEAAREAALAEARRLAQMRTEFLAHMSHELRTPLNGILGFAEILQRDPKMTEQQARGLRIIEQSGRHLLRLIDDVLDLARIDAAKLVLCPARVNLSVFLQDICDVIGVKADEKGLLFRCHTQAGLPVTVCVDEKRLGQVLLNLLSNAVKFTDRGEVTLRVLAQPVLPSDGDQAEAEAEADASRARLHFEVRDTGIGMSEGQAARLFQPFEQVSDASRRAAGTGLGLAISRELVRLMGGDVRVRSQPGEGSVFSFDIVVPVSHAPVEVVFDGPRPVGYVGPRKTILVADDVEENRLMLLEGLQQLGFEVVQARDGQECLDIALRMRPDLILMDVMMPVMDGLQATRRMRQSADLADVPIVATSASVTSDVDEASRIAGANAFVPKPINQAVLLDTLSSLLGLTWLREEEPGPAPGAGPSAADERLVYPPADQMQVLQQLARIGNMRSLKDMAEQLKVQDARYATFATQLRDLAARFETVAVMALVSGSER
jgi:PAS domain S-box-containing protein